MLNKFYKMNKKCNYIWPAIFLVSNGLCALQLRYDSENLQPFLRQYTHMTLIITALYTLIEVKQFDITAICIIVFYFSTQWHSGKNDWRLADGWLSRTAILYIGARPVIEHGLAAIVIAALMVAATWVWQTEIAFYIVAGVIGFMLFVNYEKLFLKDVLATAIFGVAGYACYRSDDLGLHGLWHSFMATSAAFAATVPKTSTWHLLMPYDSSNKDTANKKQTTPEQKLRFLS